jgi:nitrogen fixation protein NifU and related proteins
VSTDDLPLPGQVGELFHGHAREPRNLGSIENPSGQGTAIGQCGDSMDVSLRIDRGIITDIKVVPHGCIYTLVCASAMSELAKGRDLDQALELDPQEVVAALGGLPEDHIHCARLALNTLGEAISDYYKNVTKPGARKRV